MNKRPKELASEATENKLQLVRITNESANQIWLAGLGAFSKAQQEGGKMFEALAAEGEKAQERMKVAADERLTELRKKATGAWDKLARALHILNVPSRHDVDTLSKRVRVVTKNLSEEEEAHGRGRARRAREVAS